MKSKELLKIINLALSLTSFSIALLLYGEISGFEQGYEAFRQQEVRDLQETISFGFHAPTVYEFFKAHYFIVVVAFLVFTGGKLVKWESVSSLICFPSLAVVLYQYWIMIPEKSMALERQIIYPDTEWLSHSLQLDWICTFAALGLVILQLAGIYVNRFVLGRK